MICNNRQLQAISIDIGLKESCVVCYGGGVASAPPKHWQKKICQRPSEGYKQAGVASNQYRANLQYCGWANKGG